MILVDSVMMTVPRPDGAIAYVFSSVAAYESAFLLERCPLRLAVGIPETGWLDRLVHSHIERLPMPPMLWELCKNEGPHRRLMCNFYRVLSLPLPEGTLGRLVLEDDVDFAPECDLKLLETIGEIPKRIKKYALALYCSQNLMANPKRRRGPHLCDYPPGSFYGGQGLFISAALLPEMAAWVLRHGIELRDATNDLQVNHMLKAEGVRKGPARLFAVQPNIVQHIGKVTTGVGRWHCSPTFGKPWSKA